MTLGSLVSQVADRRRCHRVPGRHQHQWRVLQRSPGPGRIRGWRAPRWRDTDLQIDGPVVAELQKLFMGTWQSQNGDPLAARNYFPARAGRDAMVRAIGSSPDDELQPDLRHADVGDPHARDQRPDHQRLFRSRRAAARRAGGGAARCRRVADTAGANRFLAGVSCRTGRHYGRLLRAGVRIYERRGAILHSKTALDRRRLGHGGFDQPGLAQLSAQPRTQCRRARREFGPRCRPCSTTTCSSPMR